MEQITLGQVGVALTFIVGLIGGIGYLRTHLQKWIADSLKEEFQAVNDKIDKLQDHIDAVDMGSCKNFLVARLAEVEKGSTLDEVERERFWEQYEHYSKIGGNSYIKIKVDKLKSDGKL